MIIATLMVVTWLILLGRANQTDWVQAARVRIFDNNAAIDKLYAKDKETAENISGYSGITFYIMKKIRNIDSTGKIKKIERNIGKLKKGDLKSINTFIMPGYVLQREIAAVGKGEIHKNIMSKCFELYGKKHAAEKTKQILAKLLSYPMIGVACTLMLSAVVLGTNDPTTGFAVFGIGTLLVLVLVYAIYDELSDSVKKRRSAIIRQFPNVASKLALLVTSGMIMDRAWKETAYSRETELYQEMRITSGELDNLVSPESAYGSFINRCNTKESAKLASAIMQNLSKGNAEIGKLLKDLAREAWLERRHTAKRDAEKANSKLMIPTMLLFLAILVMLMVPVAMNFSGI